jgi:putative membrane protein
MKRSTTLAIVTAAVLSASAALAQQSTDTTGGGGTTGATTRSGTSAEGTRAGASGNSSSSSSTSNSNRSSSTASNSSDSTNRTDEKFLKDFARANADEVAAGKLAAEKAENSQVKQFGQHMVDDHSKVINKVESIASRYNVNVKDSPDLKHKAATAMLEKRDGAKFDQEYIKSQVKDHQQVVEMLQKEIREGQDPSVKQLAQQALPDVQHHLDLAKQLQAQVGGGKDSSNRTSKSDTKSSTKSSS